VVDDRTRQSQRLGLVPRRQQEDLVFPAPAPRVRRVGERALDQLGDLSIERRAGLTEGLGVGPAPLDVLPAVADAREERLDLALAIEADPLDVAEAPLRLADVGAVAKNCSTLPPSRRNGVLLASAGASVMSVASHA
jgi:hypothetical protein